jgi:Uma2 family endonuclease
MAYNSDMAALAESVGYEHVTFAGLELPLAIRLGQPFSNDQLREFAEKIEPLRVERNSTGELEIMTPLVPGGGRRESYVIRRLDLWADEHGGECFSSNTGFSLRDGSMRSPDASWISQERWSTLSEDEQNEFSPICPDFVVEIVSKSDSRKVVARKMEMWMANGAKLAWMIDPFAATVSIYRLGYEVEVLTRPEWLEADTVVVGFRLEMARLWAK